MKRVVIMREALAKITQMLVGKGIEVTMRGAQAYARFHEKSGALERINLPYLPDDASDDMLDALQGFLDHEVGHGLNTDPVAILDAREKGVFAMHNVIEDIFVESRMRKLFAGSGANLSNVGKFFLKNYTDKILAGKDVNQIKGALMVVALRAVGGQQVFKDYMNDGNKWSLLGVERDKLEQFSDMIEACESSYDCVDVAVAIRDALMPPKKPEGEPGKSGDGKGKGKPEEKKPDNKDSGSDFSDSEENEPKNDDDFTPEGDRDESDPGEKSEKPSDGKSEDGENDESKQDNESNEGDSDGNKDEKGEKDGDSERDPEHDPEGDGSEPADGEDSSGEDGEVDPKKDGAGDDPDDSLSDSGDAGDSDDDGKGKDGSDSEDSVEESELSDGGSGPEQDHESDAKKLVVKSISEDRELCASIIDGIARAMSFDDALSQALTDKAKESFKKADYKVFSRDFDKVEYLDPEAQNGSCSSIDDCVTRMQNAVDHMVGPLQKELERAVAARSAAVFTGGHRSGRLHGSALSRMLVGVHDDRVFRRKQENTTKDVAVSILIDCSGSMDGENITIASQTAYALSSVLDRIGIVNEVLGFTTLREVPQELLKEEEETGIHYSRREGIYIPIFKQFSDRMGAPVKRRLAIMPNTRFLRNNIDGESVQIAASRLAARREKRKVLMVLSDGQPACVGDMVALNGHLRSVVEDVEKTGIEVVGIGICTDAPKHFYPKNVVLDDVADLPKTVMSRVRELLLK